ncbi:hypothetical protein Plhal304r1_c009g0035201 [Plasmopara halstedii]
MRLRFCATLLIGCARWQRIIVLRSDRDGNLKFHITCDHRSRQCRLVEDLGSQERGSSTFVGILFSAKFRAHFQAPSRSGR